MTGTEFTRLEIKKTSPQGNELLEAIHNSLCGICLKDFTEKDIQENNYLLSFSASCDKVPASYNLSFYIDYINHKTCLPNKYKIQEREKWIKSLH